MTVFVPIGLMLPRVDRRDDRGERLSAAMTDATSDADPDDPIEVGGNRIVFWKAKSEMVDDEIYGPIWIADADDPNVTPEEVDEWVTWRAEEFARKRALPLEDV